MNQSKHAYLILTHNDPSHLQRIINALDENCNEIFIHVDLKSEISQFSNISSSKAPIHFIKERIDVRWGDVSVIHAEYALFKEAYHRDIFSYYHLISGADFPLKTPSEIYHFFESNPSNIYISILGGESITDKNSRKWEIYKKCHLYHFFLSSLKSKNKFISILANYSRRALMALQILLRVNRHFSIGPLFIGSQWGSFTPGFIKCLLDKENIVKKEFRMTHCCDEIYKQTIAMAEGFPIAKEGNLRYIDFGRGDGRSPYIFQEKDLDELMERPELFARKFTTPVSKSLVRRINEILDRK